MNNSTIIGVDLAKDVFQVCVYTNNKVLSNNEMTPQAFTSWIANQHISGQPISNYSPSMNNCAITYISLT